MTVTLAQLSLFAAAVLVILLANLDAPDPVPAEPVAETTVPNLTDTPLLAPMLRGF